MESPIRARGSRRGDGCGGLAEQRIVGEGAQQLEMAFARLVDAGEYGIDHAQRRVARDAPCRNAVSGTHAAIGIGGGLQRAHHPRADRDDAAAAELCPRDRAAVRSDAVRLVEGNRGSSAGSPVEEMPAAWVSVAKPTPRRRQA